jgi:hypothetical protein
VTLNATADLDDLKGAIKKVWGKRIHCAAPELEVYPAGTTVPIPDDVSPFDDPRSYLYPSQPSCLDQVKR